MIEGKQVSSHLVHPPPKDEPGHEVAASRPDFTGKSPPKSRRAARRLPTERFGRKETMLSFATRYIDMRTTEEQAEWDDRR